MHKTQIFLMDVWYQVLFQDKAVSFPSSPQIQWYNTEEKGDKK